jgi:hypothetical protein
MILPRAVRPTTAASDRSDLRDENIYSAVVVQHTGQGTAKMFTVPQGQTIPKLNGTSTSSTAAHHGTYSALTTNLEKAGELGSTIGDAGVRAMGFTIEEAAYTLTTAALRSFGAGQFEVADILAKCYAELKVSNKRQIIGPVWAFPNTGAGGGGVFTTATGATVGARQNGQLPVGRKLKIPVMVARNDVLVVEFTAQVALAFSTTTGEGAPALVWCNLIATVKGDVR